MFEITQQIPDGHIVFSVKKDKIFLQVQREYAGVGTSLSLRDLTTLRKNLNELIEYLQEDQDESNDHC